MATLKQSIQLAIREMLKKYTDCIPNNILAGYNNRVQLPADNDYIVFTVLNPFRTGTPIERTTATPLQGTVTSYQHFRLPVQIDFYGANSFDRANDIINLSRTSTLCDFFKQYNIQPIAADDAQNLTGISGEQEYVERWMVQLEVEYTDVYSTKQDVFEEVSLNIFETEL